jgi:exodeoxyribonuclease V alpha subunit
VSLSAALPSPEPAAAARALHALGLSFPAPVEDLYARTLSAEMIGAQECMAIQDLLDISGQPPSLALHAALLALFAARSKGSLCLPLAPEALSRELSGLVPNPAEFAQEIRERLAGEDWALLVGRELEPFRPLILGEAGRFLYFRKYFLGEQRLRQRLTRLAGGTDCLLDSAIHDLASIVRECAAFRGFSLNTAQMWGVYVALRTNFVVVTGGPGTGKTTLVAALLRALDRCAVRPDRIALIAPTGRAAQRLTESLQQGLARADEPVERQQRLAVLEGTTIHRLLRFQPRRRAFAHDEDYPLPLDVVIVDEVSMVDVALMEALLAAVRPGAMVVFLGDKDQLPSVDAGAVLADLIPASGGHGFDATLAAELAALTPDVSAPVAEDDSVLVNRIVVLTESNRVAGAVYQTAQRINAGDRAVVGELPSLPAGRSVPWPTNQPVCALLAGNMANSRLLQETLAGWVEHHWVSPPGVPPLASLLAQARVALAGPSDDESALAAILARLSQAVILTVLRRGRFGVETLNRALADRFRRHLDPRSGREPLFAGAPVLITRNTPGLGLFNGDLGVAVRRADGRLVAIFRRGDEVLRVPIPLLPPHELAFALTVHKSQGSENDNVLLVVPPVTGHRLLTREIVYTAITRSRGMVAIWSPPDALDYAVSHRVERCSALGVWPNEAVPPQQ